MTRKTRIQDDLDDHIDLACHIAGLVRICEEYAAERQPELNRAMDYYNGKMDDLLPEEGRSGSVSRDVRSVIRRLMPSIARTLLSNERIVDYHALRQEDEEDARQITDYVNHVVVRRSGARKAIYDAVFDALSVRTGILKWVAYKRRFARLHDYRNQPFSSLIGLEEIGSVSILAKRESLDEEFDLASLGEDNARYDFRLSCIEETVDICLEAVPRNAFLIYPGASSIEESPIVGERCILTRSELVSRGYDRDKVASILTYSNNATALAGLEAGYGGDYSKRSVMQATEEVLLYEVYVRLDQDGDGIAELYKICLAETEKINWGSYLILEMEPVDEAPYTELVAEREAHRFEGHSIAEDVMDIQRIKTALLRETLDNIYWQNKKQPALDPSKLTESGLDALYNPAFGKPITLRPGANVQEAIQWLDIPFVADKSFAMMSYLDNETQNRTGITDSAGGINPELLRDMTKFAAGLVSESGIAQAAMIVDSLSGNGTAGGGGIAKAFRGLLKLVVAHADSVSTLRKGKNWVQYDPSRWNTDMECVINLGLGAGSRERDLSVLGMILNLQKELIAIMGIENPFVKPTQLYNVLEKMTETAGFSSVAPYFSRPDNDEMFKRAQSEGSFMSPDEYRLHLQMSMERMKAEAKLALEREQMAINLEMRKVDIEMNDHLQRMKCEHEREIARMEAELDLLKHREKIALEREKSGLSPAGPYPPSVSGDKKCETAVKNHASSPDGNGDAAGASATGGAASEERSDEHAP